jgi:hypothetical protein
MKYVSLIAIFALILASGCTQYPEHTGSLVLIDCGNDVKCFEDNMETCTPSRLTRNFGEEQDLLFSMETMAEVRGLEDENCVAYMKVIEIEPPKDLPPEYVDIMREIKGKEMTCRIPMSMLSDRENQTETMSPETNYCEGSYIEFLEDVIERFQADIEVNV